MPSYREGLSTVLVEAASRKIPIITTNVPGCIDVIPNESFGFLCNPCDKDSLCEAFDRYIQCSNERISTMINKTHDHAHDNFSKDVILNHYSSKIKELSPNILGKPPVPVVVICNSRPPISKVALPDTKRLPVIL